MRQFHKRRGNNLNDKHHKEQFELKKPQLIRLPERRVKRVNHKRIRVDNKQELRAFRFQLHRVGQGTVTATVVSGKGMPEPEAFGHRW